MAENKFIHSVCWRRIRCLSDFIQKVEFSARWGTCNATPSGNKAMRTVRGVKTFGERSDSDQRFPAWKGPGPIRLNQNSEAQFIYMNKHSMLVYKYTPVKKVQHYVSRYDPIFRSQSFRIQRIWSESSE